MAQTHEIVYGLLHNMRVIDEVRVKTSSLVLVKDLESVNPRRLWLTGRLGDSDEGIALYTTFWYVKDPCGCTRAVLTFGARARMCHITIRDVASCCCMPVVNVKTSSPEW